MANKPDISGELGLYIECLYMLFRGDSIPLTDILIYCELKGIEDIEKAIYVIKHLEYLTLKDQNKKTKTPKK